MRVFQFIKRLFCNHERVKVLRNPEKKEIGHYCVDCGKKWIGCCGMDGE